MTSKRALDCMVVDDSGAYIRIVLGIYIGERRKEGRRTVCEYLICSKEQDGGRSSMSKARPRARDVR